MVQKVKKELKGKTQVCKGCGKEKHVKSFPKDNRYKGGLSTICLKCTKAKHPGSIENKRPKIIDGVEETKVPKILNDKNTELAINKRFQFMMLEAFGPNLEDIVHELKVMLKNKKMSGNVKMAVIKEVLDRVLGKPIQEQLIKQEVININIKKPDLSNIVDITPKE